MNTYDELGHDEYRRLVELKLDPHRLRSTMAFAGLYQVTHEMIKKAVLEQVKSFFGYVSLDEGVWRPESGEEKYRQAVLSLDRNPFMASLLWLRNQGVVTETDVERLDEILDHRHQLTHELLNFLIDPATEPDVTLFVDALRLLKAVAAHWAQIEFEIGTFEDYPDLELDEVIPLNLQLLQMLIDAYIDGLPASDTGQ